VLFAPPVSTEARLFVDPEEGRIGGSVILVPIKEDCRPTGLVGGGCLVVGPVNPLVVPDTLDGLFLPNTLLESKLEEREEEGEVGRDAENFFSFSLSLERDLLVVLVLEVEEDLVLSVSAATAAAEEETRED